MVRKTCVGLSISVLALALCTQIWAQAQGDVLRRGISLMKAARPIEAERIFETVGPEDADYVSAQIHLGFLRIQRSALLKAEEAFRNVLRREPQNPSAHLGLGVVLLRTGLPGEAGSELEKILTDPEVGLKAEAQWILSLIQDGKLEEALAEARQLAEEYPAVGEFHRLLGYVYQLRGDSDLAVQSYLRLVQQQPGNVSNYLTLVAIYRSEGDWGNALQWARSALALDKNQPTLYQELAIIYEKLGRAREAVAARAEAKRTFDAEILYAKAVNSRFAGDEDQAEKLLRECTANNPRLSNAWTDLGELLMNRNRFGEARQAFRNALEDSPQDARALLGLVNTLRKEGKEEQAIDYLQKAASGGRLSPDLLTAMAAALQERGNAAEAIAAVVKALDALPDDPDLLSYLGYLQLSSGRSEEAMASYTAALRLNPRQGDALFGQAQSQLMQGQTRQAISTLRRAQSLDPSNTQVLKALLGAYRKTGETDAAESVSRACLKLNSTDNECREQLAWLRVDAGDYKESAGHFQSLLSSGAESKSTLDGFAFSLMKTGKYAPAIDAYTRSLRLYGPNANVYANLGFLHRCTGDLTASISDYRHARDLAPTDADRNGDLGFILYLARDFSEAMAPLETALRLKPDWGMGHYHLAMVFWNQGQFQLALAHARVAQKLGVREAAALVRSLTERRTR